MTDKQRSALGLLVYRLAVLLLCSILLLDSTKEVAGHFIVFVILVAGTLAAIESINLK